MKWDLFYGYSSIIFNALQAVYIPKSGQDDLKVKVKKARKSTRVIKKGFNLSLLHFI
jgi:hypothetical protein